MKLNNQKTLKNNVAINGVGLHTGQKVSIKINPAPEDYGIVFRRTDVEGFNNIVRADYRNVTKTQLGTTISNQEGTMVSTVEHLMAALWGCGVDNALIDLSAAEIPIMDGSSEPFIKAIDETGIKLLDKNREVIKIKNSLEVTEEDKYIRAEPSDEFAIDLEIDFNSKAISRQRSRFAGSEENFRNTLSQARTFGFSHEVEYLRSIGLARGGSLENAVVLEGDKILNKDGLRYEDEFVRHKLLDCIGDFFLAGKRIVGSISAYKAGHGLNNKLLHKLLSDKNQFEITTHQ